MRFLQISLLFSLSMTGVRYASAASPDSQNCRKTAKNTPASIYCNRLQALFSDADADTKQRYRENLAAFWTLPDEAPAAFGYSVFKAFLEQLEQSRLDKQTGMTGTANGTTDLVSLPGTTDFISAAVNVGALTQSISGTTTTVTGNIGQVISSFNPSTYDYFLKGIPVISNLSASLSFTVDPGSSVMIQTSGSASTSSAVPSMVAAGTSSTRFSGAGVKYAFFNKFDPRSAQFQQGFTNSMTNEHLKERKALDSDLTSKLNAFEHIFSDENKDPDRQAFISLLANAPDLLSAIKEFNAYFDAVQAKAQSNAAFEGALDSLAKALAAKLNLYRTAVEEAKGPPALTVEYNYLKPQNQPETHNVRLIGALPMGNGMLTVNGAGTFYGSQPMNATYGRFRDAQMALQYDLPLGRNNLFDFSGAGYGQYQESPTILNVSASDIPSGLNLTAGAPAFLSGTQGWLGVFQAKLTITGAHGVKVVPVSYKWSNHTELFAQSSSTFQFGLSYDLSSLFQLTGTN